MPRQKHWSKSDSKRRERSSTDESETTVTGKYTGSPEQLLLQGSPGRNQARSSGRNQARSPGRNQAGILEGTRQEVLEGTRQEVRNGCRQKVLKKAGRYRKASTQ